MKLLVFLIVILVTVSGFGMHIMEGYLPPTHAFGWWFLTIPFLIYGLLKIKKLSQKEPKFKFIIAFAGAFALVLSAMKIPSVTGSCSHPTGVGLGAILFGPAPMFVIGFIVLLFQALLLAHGGLTTLGANNFSMGIVGPMVSFATYKIFRKININRSTSIFFAAFLGDLLTYIVTSFQLASAFPSQESGVLGSAFKFLGIFALTQVPIAIFEGILTVFAINMLLKYEDRKVIEMTLLKLEGDKI